MPLDNRLERVYEVILVLQDLTLLLLLGLASPLVEGDVFELLSLLAAHESEVSCRQNHFPKLL